MFQMNHDAVDFFSVDFTAACTIVAREEYPLGYFAAQAMEVSGRLDGDIDAAAKEFAAEAQMFFAARDPSSAGIANDAYGRLRVLLRELPLYNILLPRCDTMLSCFSSASEYQTMWDEMMTKGTRNNNDYTHWISRICRIGADLHEFQRNTNWMLSKYFDKLTSHRREDYIDAYGRFKDGIRDTKLVDLDDEDLCLFGDPSPYSFRFDFPAHISFIPYHDEKTGKPKLAERSTFPANAGRQTHQQLPHRGLRRDRRAAVGRSVLL